jgi:hypothetical protein
MWEYGHVWHSLFPRFSTDMQKLRQRARLHDSLSISRIRELTKQNEQILLFANSANKWIQDNNNFTRSFKQGQVTC